VTQATRRSTVVGVFHERDDAREAIEALKDEGFAPDTISILSPDKQATQSMAEETGTHAGSGAATGAVAGGLLGGLGGWLVGIGALAIPGVGPFIAAGAFATALGGAAIGAGVGAIAGALVGMGVPKEEAEYYEGEVKSGRTLVTVRADGRYDEAQRTLRQHGAYDIESRDASATPAVRGVVGGQPTSVAATRERAADTEETRSVSTGQEAERTVQLREEELQARKQPVETGQVTLGKDVVEQHKTVDVPVTREEVYVERRAVDRPADRPIDSAAEQTIEVPVREEQVEVEKRPVVYEEVGVNKQQVVESQQVSDTVRREELRVDKQGEVALGGDAAGTTAGMRGDGSWEQAMPSYRQRWQQRFGSSGGRWEDYEPGYRYGHELHSRPEYRGRNWTEVEPQLQRDWTQRNPSKPWDRVRESVRDTWENATS
jgi:uncharacterized protein (TIGR02271 family)